MGLLSCAESRKSARPVISRPLETSSLHQAYHAVPSRTGEGLRLWREAEARRKAEGKRDERKTRHRREAKQRENHHKMTDHSKQNERIQWATHVYPPDRQSQYASIQEIEDNEKCEPRGRHERYECTITPVINHRWQGAFDQLSSKGTGARPEPTRTLKVMNPSHSHDQWSSDGGLARPKQSKAVIRAQNKPPRLQIPVRPPQKIMEVGPQVLDRAKMDMGYSSIVRNAKFKPAPKQGQRVLYSEDAATATRRNMGF